MMREAKNNKGFTLVELAIVIIIIGVLIAGISAGTSLILESKLRKVVSDVTNIQSVYIAFKGKFSQIPGDFSKSSVFFPGTACAGDTDCDGNGDNMVDVGTFPDNSETLRFWQHLYLAGLTQYDFPGTGTSSIIGTNVPESPFVGTGYDVRGGVPYKNFINWAAENGTSSLFDGGITASNAYFIDIKMDDGIANSGEVLGLRGGGFNGSTDCTDNDGAGPNYTVSSDLKACRMFFYILY